MFYYYHARCCLLSWQLCYVCIHADILLLCSIFQFILSSFLSTTFWINISIDFGSMRLIWMVWVVLLNNFHNKINNKISISVEFQLLQKNMTVPDYACLKVESMSQNWCILSMTFSIMKLEADRKITSAFPHTVCFGIYVATFQNLLRCGLYSEAAHMLIFHGNIVAKCCCFRHQNERPVLTSL